MTLFAIIRQSWHLGDGECGEEMTGRGKFLCVLPSMQRMIPRMTGQLIQLTHHTKAEVEVTVRRPEPAEHLVAKLREIKDTL